MKLRTKFQDEDFELGEVVTADIATMPDGRIKFQAAAKKGGIHTILYDSLEELNEEWEDYEENEYYYAITSIKADGGITKMKNKHNDMTAFDKKIGNYFGTEEEASKAVEKLKAWKRLEDKGFKFVGWEDTNNNVNDILFKLPYMEWDKNVCDDLDLLFGDEE